MKKIIITLFIVSNITIFAANQIVINSGDSGAGSLRQAIADVGDGENVTFSSAITYPTTITLSGGITLDKSINIIGRDDPWDIVIDGNENGFIFEQTSDGHNDIIFISGLVLSNANNSAFRQDPDSEGNEFTITNCVFVDNSISAGAENGGAINAAGDSTNIIINCTFTDNSNTSSDSDGGVMENQGYLKFYGCTFSGNYAGDDGGVLCCDDENGSGAADIINCTFSGNTAGGRGAAIYCKIPSPVVAVVNIYNCTIVDNSGDYAAVFRNDGNSIMNIYSSILANNSPRDLRGDIAIVHNCIIEEEITDITDAANNLTDDPGLSALANNGGSTKTHAFNDPATSPCVNNGVNSLSLSYDQRGPGYPREQRDNIDIGSYEYSDLPSPIANAAEDIEDNSFLASWSSVSEATSYRLDVSTESDFSSGDLDLTVNDTLTNVNELLPNKDYYYRVRAYCLTDTSANSATIHVKTTPEPGLFSLIGLATLFFFRKNVPRTFF